MKPLPAGKGQSLSPRKRGGEGQFAAPFDPLPLTYNFLHNARSIISSSSPTVLKSITYSAARNNLKALLDEVEANAAPVIITRTGAPPAVLMPASMYAAFIETECLLANPNNAKVLRKSIANVKVGRGLQPMKLRRN